MRIGWEIFLRHGFDAEYIWLMTLGIKKKITSRISQYRLFPLLEDVAKFHISVHSTLNKMISVRSSMSSHIVEITSNEIDYSIQWNIKREEEEVEKALRFLDSTLHEILEKGRSFFDELSTKIRVIQLGLKFPAWKKILVVPHTRKAISYVFSCTHMGFFKYMYSIQEAVEVLEIKLIYCEEGIKITPSSALRIKEKVYGKGAEIEVYGVECSDDTLPLGEAILPIAAIKIGTGRVEDIKTNNNG